MKKLLLSAILALSAFGLQAQKWSLSFSVDEPGTAIAAPAVNVALLATDSAIYRTSDTGTTWSKVSTEKGIIRLECKDGTCYALGKRKLLKSTDLGATWVSTNFPAINFDFQDIEVLSSARVMIDTKRYHGVDSGSYVTYNGGANWHRISINFLPKEARRVLITENRVLQSLCDGPTCYFEYKMMGTGLGATFYDSYSNWQFFSDSTTGFVANTFRYDFNTDAVLKVVQIGLQEPFVKYKILFEHTEPNRNGSEFINTVSFINEKTGWFGGLYDKNKGYLIMKTNDSGKTWLPDTLGWGSVGTSLGAIKSLQMQTPTYGWALAGYYARVVKYGQPVSGPSTIKGRVYVDVNNNCQYNAGIDVPVRNKVVMVTENSFYGFTNNDGEYEIEGLGTQTYTVDGSLVSDGVLIKGFLCSNPGTVPVNITTAGSTISNIDFPLDAVLLPIPSVNVNSRRRMCARNQTVITYENLGYAILNNARVVVKKPEFVTFFGANKPHTVDAEGNWVFNVGNMAALSSGTIVIDDSVACGNIMGRTVCTEAWIFGDNVDYKTDTATWDNSEVIVKARCMNGWINFQIINTTSNPMADSAELRFLSNSTLKDTKKYKLGANDTLNFTIPADYTTWRVEADQRPGHPISKYAQATIEGCEGEGAGTVSTGQVNSLPVNDFKFKKFVDCEPIRASFDPNDKTVYPEGITANNYVKTGTQLSYRVRFQNTGNDTAFKVVVKDSLPAHLNLATFRLTGASHPHTYKITGQGKPILEVTFNNINLPDSTTDEKGSNGFFTYTAQHKTGIAQGTKIENTAYIYFDFNSPIKTNTASVTIKDTVVLDKTPLNPVTTLPFILKGYTKDTLCIGDTFKLAVIGEGPYNWYNISNPSVSLGTGFELQQTAQATALYVGVTKDGTDTIEVIVKNCAIGPDAIKEVSEGFINVYPNPSASGLFYVQMPDGADQHDLKVIDLQGREIGTVINNVIDISHARPGIYILVITSENGSAWYKKLVKE